MLVSIIVPAYNAQRTLAECLDALKAQDYPETEIIVVDDGSTDNTAAIAQGVDGITYLRQDNAGPAAARNRGAAAARGAWLAFTDSDCIAHPDWISQLMKKVRPGVVGIGGTYGIANPDSLLARIIHAEIRDRHERQPEEVDFLGSFNAAYERKAYEAAGGFDDSFSQASAEDNDLAYRLTDAGGRLCFTNEAIVDHYHPEAFLPYLKTQLRHGFWRVYLYQKHPTRKAGDSYASSFDLFAPPLTGFILFAPPIAAVVAAWQGTPSHVRTVSETALGILLILTGRRFMLALSAWDARSPSLATGYALMAFPRDVARLVGLALGLFHFHVLRRTTA